MNMYSSSKIDPHKEFSSSEKRDDKARGCVLCCVIFAEPNLFSSETFLSLTVKFP